MPANDSLFKINGKSFDVRIMGSLIEFESFSLSIEDNSETAMTRGKPDGYLRGDVSASGELKINTQNLMMLSAVAKAAGSYQDIPAFDIHAHALGDKEAITVAAYDCRIKISELLNIDPSSTERTTHTLPFQVTGKDFVDINGVPYAPNRLPV
jgi:hypothetical protein